MKNTAKHIMARQKPGHASTKHLAQSVIDIFEKSLDFFPFIRALPR